MFWLGVILGMSVGTMLGFLAAGLLGMLARKDYGEFEAPFGRESMSFPE